eukprot:scaffold142167_cov15-Prasinocladus_malaysianus.AAC.1
MCKTRKHRTPARFKVAAAILHLAQGGTWWQTGFCCGVSEAVIRKWVIEVCTGVIEVLRPEYLRKPTPEECLKNQEFFAARQGIENVGAAVDGSHIPFQPESLDYMEDFHNYKGWYSILIIALVNSQYLFMDAEVGRPGRMSDSTATQLSFFYNEMLVDHEAWLGPHGVMISDGACGINDFIMTPYPGTQLTNMQQWFNFCFSSTRMFVEQVFGQWKSRWRLLIREQQCSHAVMSLMIYATMVLHNICTIHKESCGDEFLTDQPQHITNFLATRSMPRCKHCVENEVVHCIHKNRSHIKASSTTGAMEKRRDAIAQQLWVAKCAAEAAYVDE